MTALNSSNLRFNSYSLMGIPAGAKAAPRGGRLRTPAHVSTLLDVVTTLTNRKAARCIAAGRRRGSWRPQGYPGGASTTPHGTRGCRAHVQASGCCNNPHRQPRCCWEVSRLVEVPGISRDVPVKTSWNKGLPRTCPSLWMLEQP